MGPHRGYRERNRNTDMHDKMEMGKVDEKRWVMRHASFGGHYCNFESCRTLRLVGAPNNDSNLLPWHLNEGLKLKILSATFKRSSLIIKRSKVANTSWENTVQLGQGFPRCYFTCSEGLNISKYAGTYKRVIQLKWPIGRLVLFGQKNFALASTKVVSLWGCFKLAFTKYSRKLRKFGDLGPILQPAALVRY